jgi:tRNA dimethylallyltransferase
MVAPWRRTYPTKAGVVNSFTPPLLVITGETGSGKSALALAVAQKLNGELICADSWTVRREVNIGTAKPSLQQQALAPHHLLNVAGPDEDFTAAVFKRLAFKAIEDISARGKLPILVGGTGLYIDSILYDYGFLPSGDRSVRAEWEAMTTEEVLAEVETQGISTSAIDIHNKRRLIRLLETGGAKPTKQTLRQNTLIIGIKIERELLRQRVISRVDSMFANGLEAEVYGLVERYGWNCEALKGVGYAQWQDYFSDTKTIEETKAAIISATMNLAKRQRTWFKRNKSIQWFSAPVQQTKIVELVTTYFSA